MTNPKIIAVDFDGCLCDSRYPECGVPFLSVVNALKAEQDAGAKVVLWTCRRDEALCKAVEWCEQQGIFFDAVNENLPGMITCFGTDTRKIFANEYWDDRARMMPEPRELTCGAISCEVEGEPITRGLRKCSVCNRIFHKGDRFCPHCGRQIRINN